MNIRIFRASTQSSNNILMVFLNRTNKFSFSLSSVNSKGDFEIRQNAFKWKKKTDSYFELYWQKISVTKPVSNQLCFFSVLLVFENFVGSPKKESNFHDSEYNKSIKNWFTKSQSLKKFISSLTDSKLFAIDSLYFQRVKSVQIYL